MVQFDAFLQEIAGNHLLIFYDAPWFDPSSLADHGSTCEHGTWNMG